MCVLLGRLPEPALVLSRPVVHHGRVFWGYIIAAIAGASLSTGGGYIAQMRAERAASAREEREREHEREVWARGLRHEVHVAFLAQWDRFFDMLTEVDDRPDNGSEPPEDFLLPVWRRLESVRLVCLPATAAAGQKACASLMALAFSGGQWEQASYDRDQYLAAVRDEFGLPAVPVMGDAQA